MISLMKWTCTVAGATKYILTKTVVYNFSDHGYTA